MSLEFFEEAKKLLGSDLSENNLITLFSNVAFLENILEGKIMGLQASLEDLFKDQNREIQLKEFKEKIEEWKRLADKLKEKQHELLKKKYEAEMVEIDAENERKNETFKKEMKKFQEKGKQFEKNAKKIFENILEMYKHNHHKETTKTEICSKFITVMDGLDSALKFDWFKRDDFKCEVTICLEHLVLHHNDFYLSGYAKVRILKTRQKVWEKKIRPQFTHKKSKMKIDLWHHQKMSIEPTDKEIVIEIINQTDDPIHIYKVDIDEIKVSKTICQKKRFAAFAHQENYSQKYK